MQKIRFVVIGCGQVSKRHLDIILEYGELQAVCDADETIAKNTGLTYHTPFFTSLDQLIQYISADVAVICTPNGLHAPHAIQLLENGFHVLVEKPMALSVPDAKKMMAVAKQHERHLFTVLQNRFNPPVQALHKAIQQGSFGKLFSVQVNCFWNRNPDYYIDHSWHGSREMDGGILFTQCSHFIDLLLWCFGPAKEVAAFMHNVHHSYTALAADEGAVLLQFENGMIGTLQFSVNSFKKNMEGSLTLLAEKATLKIGGTYLDTITYAEMDTSLFTDIPAADSPLKQVYQSMIRTLETNEPFYTHPEESLATIQLIEQIHSIANRK